MTWLGEFQFDATPSAWTRHDASWCSLEAASKLLLHVAASTTKSICAPRLSEVWAPRRASIVDDSPRVNRRKKWNSENAGWSKPQRKRRKVGIPAGSGKLMT